MLGENKHNSRKLKKREGVVTRGERLPKKPLGFLTSEVGGVSVCDSAAKRSIRNSLRGAEPAAGVLPPTESRRKMRPGGPLRGGGYRNGNQTGPKRPPLKRDTFWPDSQVPIFGGRQISATENVFWDFNSWKYKRGF